MQTTDRRSFLKTAGAGSALAGGLLNLNPRALGANEKVTLALIGGHSEGKAVAKRTIQHGGVIKTFCDIDDAVLAQTGAELAALQDRKPGFEKDFRRALEDKDIDAVIIAAPDHWHARMMILACQAGKDVYVEKPLSQTIHEGLMMREAARKYKRIVQVGTQRRSGEHFRSAVEFAAAGKLGKICEMKACVYQVRTSIGRPPDSAPPAGVDYDAWLGPAPERSFNPNRFHYNWRFFWDYGNTELGNQGVHMLDIAIWVIEKMRGLDRCLPSRVSSVGGIYWLNDAKEVPDTQIVNYYYDNLLLSFELRSFASDHTLPPGHGNDNFFTAFYGTEGTLRVTNDYWKVFWADGRPAQVVKASGGSHEANFLACVKSRETPNADVEVGRLSTTLCHLGNISYRLGRDVVFDSRTNTFGGDKDANRLLSKEYRAPYGLPAV